jgi:hypothetical protein
MTDTYKVLGQALTGATEITVYTVPGGTKASISAIEITNSDTASQTYKVSVVPSLDTASESLNKHYIIYNKTIASGETHEIKGGVTLSAGDQIRVYSTSNEIITNVYGVEIA